MLSRMPANSETLRFDEVEARLVGLAAQARGDDEDVAVLGARIVTGIDARPTDGGATVHEVERLALGKVGVGIEDLDFRDKARALEGKRRVGTDAATAADDGDFHLGDRSWELVIGNW